MLLTITRTDQSRVVALDLVNVLTIEVGNPSLDVPCRDKDGDMLVLFSRLHALHLARIRQFYVPAADSRMITIKNHNEPLRDTVAIGSVGGQFLGESSSNELHRRTAPRRRHLHSKPSPGPSRFLEESSGECLVLSVFA